MKKLFIHIPKNGGMTIRWPALSGPLKPYVQIVDRTNLKSGQYIDNVKLKMIETGHTRDPGLEHGRWRDVHPDVTSKMTAFAIARNPWDRVVSKYWFAYKGRFVEKNLSEDYVDVSSFEAFLEERHKWIDVEYMWHRAIRHWTPVYDHVCDENDIVRCDIIRLEHLNDEICKYLGIEEMTRARNVTDVNKKTYQEMYTPETIQIVADLYQKDIDYWGYDFDSSATKNYWALNNET